MYGIYVHDNIIMCINYYTCQPIIIIIIIILLLAALRRWARAAPRLACMINRDIEVQSSILRNSVAHCA